LLSASSSQGLGGETVAPSVEDRLGAARACVAGLAADDWTHDTPPSADWLTRDRWCSKTSEVGSAAGTLPCDSGVTEQLTLRVEFDREHPARVDRVALQLSLDPDSPWRVQFYGTAHRVDPGDTLGGPSYSLATVAVSREGPDGEPETLSLTRFPFEVGDRVVIAPGEYLPPSELRARFATPETLREAVLAQLDNLQTDVTGLLDREQLSLCPESDSLDRYQCGPMGDGQGHAMYDTCVRRGLTDEEKAETRARLRTEIEASRALISSEFGAIHRAVTAALPVDDCWLLVGP